MSIMRPALISRSASLSIASISSGVGMPVWAEVTIDMKRMEKLLFEASRGPEPAKLSRY